jgi:hypothetical protein
MAHGDIAIARQPGVVVQVAKRAHTGARSWRPAIHQVRTGARGARRRSRLHSVRSASPNRAAALHAAGFRSRPTPLHWWRAVPTRRSARVQRGRNSNISSRTEPLFSDEVDCGGPVSGGYLLSFGSDQPEDCSPVPPLPPCSPVVWADGSTDTIRFQSDLDTAAVPEPASFVLVGSGISGLVVVARMRCRHRSSGRRAKRGWRRSLTGSVRSAGSSGGSSRSCSRTLPTGRSIRRPASGGT